MLRIDPAAEDSLAAILARNKFGIAIAAMIRMIATTISNSISEKPFCLRIFVLSSSWFVVESRSQRPDAAILALTAPLPVITKVSAFPLPTHSNFKDLDGKLSPAATAASRRLPYSVSSADSLCQFGTHEANSQFGNGHPMN